MEFLRFGSSIPGSYWGCCAVDIIQNFKFDPDTPASIQIVSGDSSTPIMRNGKGLFAGKTYREIFLSRLNFGTFSSSPMPNHAFIAVLTENQISSGYGKKWLKILKENGFEFIRSVSNSVYTGGALAEYTPSRGGNKNYIFMLVRNIGVNGDGDSLTPPQEWLDLPKVLTEAWEVTAPTTRLAVAKEQHAVHTQIWNRNGPPVFYTEDELNAAGVPVVMAGLRSEYPQESKELRDMKRAAKKPSKTSAFPQAA